MSKTIMYKIEGMHCTSCAMHIDWDLEDTDGVNSAKTNYAKSETKVTFDEKIIAPSAIIEIIKRTGYQAKQLNKA